ncbi:MAG: S8 family serine peptidase [Armatimonadetes bacterium]|nr:S8 family serine peptidase [Armatimonadota bacterium]
MIRRTTSLALAACAASFSFAGSVKLKALEFDPSRSEPVVPAAWKSAPVVSDAVGRFLLQTPGSFSEAGQRRIEALGLRIDAYLPDDTYIVKGRPSALRAASKAGLASWYGSFHPFYKLSPELGLRSFATPERQAERAAGQVRATVHVFVGEEISAVVRAASAAGLDVVSQGAIGRHELVEVRGRLDAVKSLAKVGAVQFIEESGEWSFRNDKTTWVVQSNVTNSRPLWDHGLKGQNMTVGLIDGAMSMNHNCFKDPNGNPIGPNHRKVVMYSGTQGSDSHGTHTAGTIAGDREPVNGLTLNNGHATKAKIAFTNLGTVNSSNLYSKFVAAYNAGARDHSNSWGDDSTTAYTSWCQAIDQFSYDFEDAMVAFAVTNQSLLKTPENAKSCLGVGATNQTPSQHTIGSGGRGPTSDGRRKPEIFAPGIGIVSANGSNDTFASLSGTSMACPAITGEAALIRQWYKEGRFAKGSVTPFSSWNASGALIRATVMNGGVDMTGVSGYPTNNEGFGRLLADNVLWFPGEQRRTWFWDVRRAQGLAQGSSRTFTVIVKDANAPLRITMSFTDYAATVNASSAAVNDVDLKVVAPTGSTYLGNVFNTTLGESTPGGAADAKNSTEMVVFNAPVPGAYEITISVPKVAQGGTQGFALVVNGDLAPVLPIGLP